MTATLFLISSKLGEINKFLSKFYEINLNIFSSKNWKKEYKNPIELTDMIGVFLDNIENYNLSLWINIDPNIYIKISPTNRR